MDAAHGSQGNSFFHGQTDKCPAIIWSEKQVDLAMADASGQIHFDYAPISCIEFLRQNQQVNVPAALLVIETRSEKKDACRWITSQDDFPDAFDLVWV
nr:hypothetical protein [Desulfonatronum thioautotrophicum]